jgi:hypothetical protein
MGRWVALSIGTRRVLPVPPSSDLTENGYASERCLQRLAPKSVLGSPERGLRSVVYADLAENNLAIQESKPQSDVGPTTICLNKSGRLRRPR